jgi:hypothetical protein
VRGNAQDEVFEVVVPPSWLYGLDDLPGYDAQSRRLRLTTRLEVAHDEQERPVGFLGRAHPLVRRALDRVRNLSFGTRNGQAPRVSAVTADVPQPMLLYTFLGRVSSQAGREFERVLTVEVPAQGEPRAYDEASAWLPLADPTRAIRTAGVWEQYFAHWAGNAHTHARDAAAMRLNTLAAAFIEAKRQALAAEREALQQWFTHRVHDLTEDVAPAFRQRELCDTEAASPAWAHLTDAAERLAAFATDASQSPARRSEADGVLRIHRQRQMELEARFALGEPEIVPLGVLMIVPEV